MQYMSHAHPHAGRELAIGFWGAAVALVLGHVLISLALREGVLGLQVRLRTAQDVLVCEWAPASV